MTATDRSTILPPSPSLPPSPIEPAASAAPTTPSGLADQRAASEGAGFLSVDGCTAIATQVTPPAGAVSAPTDPHLPPTRFEPSPRR